jgi:hypothetical protein
VILVNGRQHFVSTLGQPTVSLTSLQIGQHLINQAAIGDNGITAQTFALSQLRRKPGI